MGDVAAIGVVGVEVVGEVGGMAVVEVSTVVVDSITKRCFAGKFSAPFRLADASYNRLFSAECVR